jgi:hypothetical protein
MDPWQEAAKLADLPQNAAAKRLAGIITALPQGSSAQRDPFTLAARLIGLLPHPARAMSHTTQALPEAGYKGNLWILFFCVFTILTLAAQWMAANQQSPAKNGNPQAAASSILSPQKLPPKPGG